MTIIIFTVLSSWHCNFKSSNHQQCSNCPTLASTQANGRRLHWSTAWFTANVVNKQRHFNNVIGKTLLIWWVSKCMLLFPHLIPVSAVQKLSKQNRPSLSELQSYVHSDTRLQSAKTAKWHEVLFGLETTERLKNIVLISGFRSSYSDG